MLKRNQHVIPLGNGWAVKAEGKNKLTIITETKREATFVARSIAKNNKSEIIIHGKDGKTQSKKSYNNEPLALNK